MTSRTFASIAVAAALLLLQFGCAAPPNSIHQVDAPWFQEAQGQSASLVRVETIWESAVYYPEGSIAGALQSGLEDMFGSTDGDELKAASVSLRERMINMLEASLAHSGLSMRSAPVASDHAGRALFGGSPQARAALAEQLQLHALLEVRFFLHTHPGWTSTAYRVTGVWELYDATGQRRLLAETQSDGGKIGMGAFDARDIKHSEAYIHLVQQNIDTFTRLIAEQVHPVPAAPPLASR